MGSDDNNCDANAACTNTDGSFTCACNDGWDGTGDACEDVDECASTDDNNCDANASCTNTDGSFTCACNENYTGDGETCKTACEVFEETSSCPTGAECKNGDDGSHSCVCSEGFNNIDDVCQDINECDGTNDCTDLENCVNTDGSYTCDCKDGYEKDSNDECIDKNECDDNPCTDIETCDNTVGSYTCSCNKGYEANTAMILNNGVCECNEAKNFELDADTETCKCTADTNESVDGICRKADDGVRWGDPEWGSCTDGKRQRPLKAFDCKKNENADGVKIAFWSCDVTRARVFEDCGEDATDVICTDYNAEFDAADGVCKCKSGFFDTPEYGCLLFENETDAPSKAIVDEIKDRLQAILDAESWPNFNDNKRKRTAGFYEKQAVKTERKSKSSCGKKSRGANPLFYKNIKELYEAFKTEADKPDTDGAALANLIELYSVWVKQSLFNCYNMGYGSDPQDGHTDADGVTCEKSNQKETTKCRFEFKQANYYNRFAEQKISFN